ncbi:MAG: 1-acyl-sn-glycerol-3-phosphate acyltransferase, partial [Chloroflexi bacterium]|nr:1-acyl-sn-glycerol-3-phosphate acyltransferase [Chloroflexota bacterium]
MCSKRRGRDPSCACTALFRFIAAITTAGDRSLLEMVLVVLQSGRPLMMAPEGGRSHSLGMRRAKPGIGYIIEHARVPIVPAGILGTTDDFWQRAKRGEKPQLEIRIGRPIQFPPLVEKGAARREARQHNADL